MSFSVERCADGDEWNELLDRMTAASVFHRSSVLNVLADHSAGTVHRLVGYKGREPIGVFPVFELAKAGVTAAFSPPPRLGVPFQGPVLFDQNGLKQRKRERRNRRFIDACLEWIDDAFAPRYVRVCTTPGYEDVRPFEWASYTATPRYTYTIDLTPDPDAIKRSFSRTPRKNIESNDADLEITNGSAEEIRFIHDQIRSRYETQGKRYTVPLEFLLDLREATPPRTVRTYVGRIDDEPTAGLITLEDENTVYFSEGGGKPDADVSCNDHLHWRVIRDAKARRLSRYDLQGANVPRICEYKAKFNPRLRSYYELERGTPLMRLASACYRRLR
ncbi:GNAT family N-acetyltransferase [Natronococcus sp. A-GB1]|uniref:GNAT family N-acetyltransferase n=1 Tax=Natronococcus sp. A-GB1 TaxID=3037648 RepID=UPI00241C3575|nr:GNAT family N-acetyltransferase [Natronococcus sp. A-GB1]MDG5761821.1 GNAT family N-acetyltransferase [Natronococcus sp. A-GB1]